MTFKAAIFDYDGTITEKGVYEPTREMAGTLCRVAKKVPIAFCTGRQLESFEESGLDALLQEIPESEAHAFLENVYLIAENGAIGYYFDSKLDRFEEFYRVDWPSHFINKKNLEKKLEKAIGEYGTLLKMGHKEVVVMRTKHYVIPVEQRDIDEVYKCAVAIFEIGEKVLTDFDPNFRDFVHIGNAGIGVLIGPANGDKDNGIKMFAEILKNQRDFEFKDDKFREILVIGDHPLFGGNDHYLLKGTYGTPFTVGEYDESAEFPGPVVNEEGKRLLHAEGSKYLLETSFSI